MKRFCIILLYFFGIQFAIGQQLPDDKSLILIHIKGQQAANDAVSGWKVKMRWSYNPVKLLVFAPLFVYQRIISEQVSAVCEFEPSCSNFGVQSIVQLGIIKGLFLTADRLTRCNGEAQIDTQYYLIDHHTGKVIDEPSMYRYKN